MKTRSTNKEVMTKKKKKATETRGSSVAKAMKAQGMPKTGNPVDVSDNVLGQEADAFFGPMSDMYADKKSKSKKYKLKKKKKKKDMMKDDYSMEDSY